MTLLQGVLEARGKVLVKLNVAAEHFMGSGVPHTPSMPSWSRASAPWPVLMPTCTSVGARSRRSRAMFAMIPLLRSTMTTTASPWTLSGAAPPAMHSFMLIGVLKKGLQHICHKKLMI